MILYLEYVKALIFKPWIPYFDLAVYIKCLMHDLKEYRLFFWHFIFFIL